MTENDIYVLVTENDKPHRMPNRDDPFFDDGGPLIFEQYTRNSDLVSVCEKRQTLEPRYGKCRIAKLVFLDEEEK